MGNPFELPTTQATISASIEVNKYHGDSSTTVFAAKVAPGAAFQRRLAVPTLTRNAAVIPLQVLLRPVHLTCSPRPAPTDTPILPIQSHGQTGTPRPPCGCRWRTKRARSRPHDACRGSEYPAAGAFVRFSHNRYSHIAAAAFSCRPSSSRSS